MQHREDHHDRHLANGPDELLGDLNANARVGVRESAGATFKRRRLSFVEGSARLTITVADDSANEEVDVTIDLSMSDIATALAGNGLDASAGALVVDPQEFTAAMAGTGLAANGDALDVTVGAGLEISSDAVRIAAAAAGNGLTGGAGSALAVSTGSGLEISSDAVRIAAAAAGSGLTGGAGSALGVGAGTGITVNADDVAQSTGMHLLSSVVRATDGAIQFASIPQGYTHLRLVALVRMDIATSLGNLYMRINNVSSAASHASQFTNGYLTTTASVAGANTAAYLCHAPGTSNTASVFGHVIIDFPYYSTTTALKSGHASGGFYDGAAGQASVQSTTWHRVATTAISQIDLITGNGGAPSANNFLTGSRAQLYGIF